MSVPWPPPKVPTYLFITPPGVLVEGGSKRRLKGNEALKWLWRITEETEARNGLPEHPFHFNTTWRKGVMTANVHSAREMAATVPIATLWAEAGRAPFASESMVRAICAAIKLRRTVAKGDFSDEMQPFATSKTLDTIGTEILRLVLCAHAETDAESLCKILASATEAWRALAVLDAPGPWQVFIRRAIEHAKSVIGKAYAYSIAQWQCVPTQGICRTIPPDEARVNVHDALKCNPNEQTKQALQTLSNIYGAPATPSTPISSALQNDVIPTFEGEGFIVPELRGNDDLVRAL